MKPETYRTIRNGIGEALGLLVLLAVPLYLNSRAREAMYAAYSFIRDLPSGRWLERDSPIGSAVYVVLASRQMEEVFLIGLITVAVILVVLMLRVV